MKQWYQSKTMWVAILTGIAGVLTVFAGNSETGGMVTALGLVNMLLRLVTSEPIA